ncbi:MAG: tRNA pseudouridine(55) synthase TruB [Candidatus Faecousia sp.]|nr:tRNA pseudouridine(55) synthase TruB [Candidatus Faecousia sp.]
MANGILIVDKPAGWTSQDVAAKLRGVFHEKRVGHGGTLDPMATGVLPIFIGRATRAVPFFEHADKVYEAGLRLGLVTDTQDVTGQTLETHEVDITQERLEAALDNFRGEIAQIPPMYSAIKVNGQKLYALARQGKAVERAPRPVTIFALDLLGGAGADWRLRVHCSKGTYVRTLCHDIGAALGCGGCLSALRRTRAGAYDVTRSHTMAEILAAENPEALLLPTDSLFSDRPALKVAENAERKLRNGAPLHTPKLKDGEYRVYNQAGDFLLLAQVANGELKTVKSFFEV